MKNIKGDVCPIIIIQLGTKVSCCWPDFPECGFYSVKGQTDEEMSIGCKWQDLEKEIRQEKWRLKEKKGGIHN